VGLTRAHNDSFTDSGLIGLGVVTAAGLVVASAILATAYWANTRFGVANTSRATA
jgi:hypothetical protein